MSSAGNGSTNSNSTNSNGAMSPHANDINQILPGYVLGKQLGTGSYGQVRLALHSESGQEVAIKLMDKSVLKPEQIERVFEEFHTMKMLAHPNIVQALDLIEHSNYLCLVMQYCKGGDLLELIKHRRRLREERAKSLFFQLIIAIEHAHNSGYIHRDLKAENLFLLDTAAHHLIVGDWGFAGKWENGKLLSASFGSLHYAAPEICGGKEYTGPEVDIWSCGVILYAMVCGALPFSGSDEWNVYQKIIVADYQMPVHVSEDCASLIKIMLVPNRDKRATIQDIKKHPFLIPKSLGNIPKLSLGSSGPLDIPISPKVISSPRARSLTSGAEELVITSPRNTPNGSPRVDSPRFPEVEDSTLDRKLSRFQTQSGRKQFSITNLLRSLVYRRDSDSEKEKEKEKESNEPATAQPIRKGSGASPEKEKRIRSISFTRKKSVSRGSLHENDD